MKLIKGLPRPLLTMVTGCLVASWTLAAPTARGQKMMPDGRPSLLHHVPGSSYLSTAAGRAVFLRGDHTWTDNISFSRTGQFDFRRYLDLLSSEGSNLVRYWMWVGTIDTKAGRALLVPFLKAPNGQWDLTRFNQVYFDHVAADADAAASRGIYLSVMAFFDYDPTGDYGWRWSVWNGANNVNGTPVSDRAVEQSDRMALPLQRAYLEKLLLTLGHKPNVLWEIANEPQNTPETVEWEDGLVRFIHDYQAAHGLLRQPVGITANYPENDQSKINGRLEATSADWIAPNGQQLYRTNSPVDTGRKVQIVDTDHTFGMGGDGDWVWRQFTRGHGGVNVMDDMRGTGLPGVFAVGPGNQTFEEAERLALREVSEVTRMVDITTMLPSEKLASTGYALVDPARGEYVVLASGGGAVTLDLRASSEQALRVRWLDVPSGALSEGGVIEGGGQPMLGAPSRDAVLVVTPANHRDPSWLTRSPP